MPVLLAMPTIMPTSMPTTTMPMLLRLSLPVMLVSEDVMMMSPWTSDPSQLPERGVSTRS